MDIGSLLHSLFFEYTLRTVALGTAIIGLVSGSLGAFAVLRRQSLLGDAISHATLPGVVLAFMITRSKLSLVLIIGGVVAGWLATLLVMAIVRHTALKEDSALGVVLSVFFGFGLMLLTLTQRLPDARQAGLDRFLFGQAAAIVERDVLVMAVLGVAVLGLMVLFWKEFKLLSFDPEFAASLGLPTRWLDVLLTTLLVIAIVIGLQAVGVILMSAMVVAPAAAARQWTHRLGLMVGLSGLFGAVSGVTGALISSSGAGLATGPVIVLVMSAVVLFSFAFGKERGLVWRWISQRKNRRRLRLETVLSDLLILEQQHPDDPRGHAINVLRLMNASRGGVAHTLSILQSRGWVQENESGWRLTPAGRQEAEALLAEMDPTTTPALPLINLEKLEAKS